MFGDSERRNQALDHIRESLKQDPANLELANRYWGALAGPGGDLRDGHHVIEAYREAALQSTDGAVSLARAYQELSEATGEGPRLAYFDESLIQALKNCVPQLPESDGSAVEWILNAIRA